jgi:hypothetical protein
MSKCTGHYNACHYVVLLYSIHLLFICLLTYFNRIAYVGFIAMVVQDAVGRN